jgi:putative tricarboxylic transport membrane protein
MGRVRGTGQGRQAACVGDLVWRAPGISDAQKQALVALVERMAKSPAWQEELKKRDWTGIFLAGEEFGRYLQSETERIEGILKDLGLAA